jgi:hypothetical protein
MACNAYHVTNNPAECTNYLQKYYIHLRCGSYFKQVLLPLFQAGQENCAKISIPKKRKLFYSLRCEERISHPVAGALSNKVMSVDQPQGRITFMQ